MVRRGRGYDPYLPDDAWPNDIERLDVPDLFARSSAVTLHLPLTDTTREFVGTDLLGRMPSGSYLVNRRAAGLLILTRLSTLSRMATLRGSSGRAAPGTAEGHLLLGHPRALITPHVAWYSTDAEMELRRKAAQNIVDWARTGRPTHAVVEADPNMKITSLTTLLYRLAAIPQGGNRRGHDRMGRAGHRRTGGDRRGLRGGALGLSGGP